MNRTLTPFSDAVGQSRSAAGDFAQRATLVLAAAVVSSNILTGATRADTSFSGTLEATLTVVGFLDAQRHPIAKPDGLTLENVITFSDDSFVVIEGDATASGDAVVDVVADDPSDLVVGDRFEFDFAVSGTTVFPTGFSFVNIFGSALIVAENGSPDPVTILFDFDYDYAASTSVDNPELEQAYVIVDYLLSVDLNAAPISELFAVVDNNESLADMGTAPFEITLAPGEFEGLTVGGGLAGDPIGAPEPSSWTLGALVAAMTWGAGRRRRSSDG